ncbi:ribonuclease P protein component [Patescibacteria group bacterium]|nr:ribonuclease P protein component [Patescibacteria group bacterium]
MLSGENRIVKKKDFENIFRRGVSFKEGFLSLKINRNSSQKSRFAFVVSRKVSKKATTRNKIRRQLRELIKLRADKIKKGIDCIFIVLPGIGKKNFEEIKGVVDSLLKKAKLI